MAYKIEDIDWHKVPVGAVEFSLEDDDYFLTWFDEDGNYWNYKGSYLRSLNRYDDGRERHRVIDHHPSANRKSTREERLDKALRTLIETCFYGDDLMWRCEDDATLEHIDPDLHKEIVDLLK